MLVGRGAESPEKIFVYSFGHNPLESGNALGNNGLLLRLHLGSSQNPLHALGFLSNVEMNSV